jgi:hypothetical protein
MLVRRSTEVDLLEVDSEVRPDFVLGSFLAGVFAADGKSLFCESQARELAIRGHSWLLGITFLGFVGPDHAKFGHHAEITALHAI